MGLQGEKQIPADSYHFYCNVHRCPKLCHVVNEIFADMVLFVSVNNLTLAQGYLYSILYYLLGQVNKLEIFSWPFFVIFKPANNTSTHCHFIQ